MCAVAGAVETMGARLRVGIFPLEVTYTWTVEGWPGLANVAFCPQGAESCHSLSLVWTGRPDGSRVPPDPTGPERVTGHRDTPVRGGFREGG